MKVADAFGESARQLSPETAVFSLKDDAKKKKSRLEPREFGQKRRKPLLCNWHPVKAPWKCPKTL